MPFYGAAILCLDDENIQQILPRGQSPHNHLRRERPGGSAHHQFSAGHMAQRISSAISRAAIWAVSACPIPGAHNVLNAAAAVAVGLELEIPVDTIREALADFSGVDRRFQVRGSERGITVIDDYGHHPTEIRATLAAARACRYQTRARALPAASLHPDSGVDGRFRARLSSGRHRARRSIFTPASELPIEGVTSRSAG